jgi:transposase-like protein
VNVGSEFQAVLQPISILPPGSRIRSHSLRRPARDKSSRQADRDEGRRQDGLTSAEREELTRLRRENRQLRQERDILAKAAAW